MNFADFKIRREGLLRNEEGIIDCAETNLYAAFSQHVPIPIIDPDHRMHRCHLATDWTQFYGLPEESAPRALISCGVRDSLKLLFDYYATRGASLWLPSDNYPVYAVLAKGAGISTQEFTTLPIPRWPDNPVAHDSELLLITNPLKPLGRWLSDNDLTTLIGWVSKSPDRRLIVDSVYTFDNRFHASTMRLLETGQAILLHSLTKGWLHPKTFGVALVPEKDAQKLTPVFRNHTIPQLNLAQAKAFLSAQRGLPMVVAGKLKDANDSLRENLLGRLSIPEAKEFTGYFIFVPKKWDELLRETKLLGLPASVFGSSVEEATILSSLAFLKEDIKA